MITISTQRCFFIFQNITILNRLFKKQLLSVFFIFVLIVLKLSAQPFVHPGGLHKLSDLQRMKYMVQAHIEPWYTSFTTLSANSKSSSAYVVQGDPSLTVITRDAPYTNLSKWYSDANAAYYNALMWAVTGDTLHAAKAVQIFKAWSNLTQVTGGGTESLNGGLLGFLMVEAAEIIKSTYPGWLPADVQKFKDMLVYPGYSNTVKPASLSTTNGTFYWRIYMGDPGRHGNQDLAGMRTMLSMGVFLDNRIMYDRALRYYSGLPHRSDDFPYATGPSTATTLVSSNSYNSSYNYTRGTSIADYGYNGVLTNYFWENGQCQESSRDQGHSALGGALCEGISEIAWNQGNDVYSLSNNRLLLGLNYATRYNVSAIATYPDQPAPWEPTAASGEYIQRFDRTGRWLSKKINPFLDTDTVTLTRGSNSITPPVWEIGLAHYASRQGLPADSVKWLTRARDKSIELVGYESHSATTVDADHPGFGGLSFRRPALTAGDPVYFVAGQPVYKMNIITDTIQAENFDHFTTDGQNKVYYDHTVTNTGGQYRTNEAVDIETCTEGGYNLTSVEAGEWVNYTVAVPASGHYKIAIRYAALAGGRTIKFAFNGTDKTDFVAIPFGGTASNGSQDWQTFTVSPDITLKAGVQSLRVFISGISNTFQINHYTVSYVSPLSQQTIIFPAIPTKTTVSADFDPGATTSSGLPVTYTSSNSAVATIVNNIIHIVGGGTAAITASQAGNDLYDAAPNVIQTLTVTGIAAGDYVSSGNMNWNGGTWNISDSVGGISSTTTTAPTTSINVHILAGHTVTLATTAGNARNLTIQDGATLLQQIGLTVAQTTIISGTETMSNTLTVNNLTISETGVLAATTPPQGSVNSLITNNAVTININGRMGAPAGSAVSAIGSGIRIFVNGTGTTTFTGTGVCNIARFSPNGNNANNQNIVIDMDMEIRNFAGPGVASLTLQNGNMGSAAKVLMINTGKTVKLNGNSGLGAFHGAYANAYGNVVANNTGGSMVYSINGTLDCSAAQFNLVTNQQTASNFVTVNVNGTLKVGATVRMFRYLTAQKMYVNVADDGVVDGSSVAMNLNPVTNGQSINTSNVTANAAVPNGLGGVTFTGNNPVVGGPYAFSGTGGLGYATVASVLFTGGTLNANQAATNAIANITNGAVTGITVLSTGTYSVKPTGLLIVGGGVPTQWFAISGTDQTGMVQGLASASVETPFWMGASNTSYNPVTINPAAASVCTVSLLQGNSPAGLPSASYAVNRTWDIEPATASATSLTFGYNNTDVNADCNPAGNMSLMHYNSSTSAWEITGTTATPVAGIGTDKMVTYTGISNFSPFTLINSAVILPVSLLSFTATLQLKSVDVSWNTVNENNVKEYQVLRSANGSVFQSIGTKTAAGNSTMTRSYQFTDVHPLPGTSYYQLKSVDHDGNVSYSKIVTVNFGGGNESVTVINPVENGIITVIMESQSKPAFQIYDYLGRKISFALLSQSGNTYRLKVNSPAIKSAVLSVVTAKGNYTKKIVFKAE